MSGRPIQPSHSCTVGLAIRFNENFPLAQAPFLARQYSRQGLRLILPSKAPLGGAHARRRGAAANLEEDVMTKVGTFTKTYNGYAGHITTLAPSAELYFEPAEKLVDKSPD